MGGEPLQATALGEGGIPGDRVISVYDAEGRLVTSRSRPRLLLHRGAFGTDGQPRVDGRPWKHPEVTLDIEAVVGKGAHLERYEALDRFDVLPLLVATDGAVAHLGYDRRRFRPNLLLAGVSGLTERQWAGRTLAIGDARIRLVDLRERCIMVTFDPDTAKQDKDVLLRVHRELDGVFALDAMVTQPGRVRVGDEVTLLD